MQRRHEIELLLLTAFAAVPLYMTAAIGPVPLIAFHAAMLLIVARVAAGKSPAIIGSGVMRALAIFAIFFYLVDAVLLSRSAIAASTHLVLFIAAYQAIESARANNDPQRLLATALIFTASIATSTHIAVLLFVVVFAFVLFRQMMHVSHLDTIRVVDPALSSGDRDYAEPPSSRAATFYLCGTAVIAAILFPFIPRVRNPFVQGMAGALTGATTGISDTINFNVDRTSTQDPAVVARVWMGQDTIPFFTPLRMRAAVYDRFDGGEWRQSRLTREGDVRPRDGFFRIAHPVGFTRGAAVQQRYLRNNRLLLPQGTYAVGGLNAVFAGKIRESYYVLQTQQRDVIQYEVSMARAVAPLVPEQPGMSGYQITDPVAHLARSIVGTETNPQRQAEAIERYLNTRFRYLQRPELIGHPMTVDEFLLRERRGHCEYFAAGMVALLNSLGVPARIVGGFYGGKLNPLTGYFIVRKEDAHAWVEAWIGGKWTTFDPTPATLRPGNTQQGLFRAYLSAIDDSVTYFWDRYVLTYGLGDQIAFAAELISRTRALSEAARNAASSATHRLTSPPVALTFALAAAAIAAATMLLRRRRTLFDLLVAHLARRGIEVGPSMTMEEALRALREQHPEAARELEPLIALYEAERFSPVHDRGRVAAVRRRLSELRT